jgi:hypothetical protein
VCFLSRLGTLLWQVAGGWGPTSLKVEAFGSKLAGLWSVGLVCLKGTGQQSGDPECLWIACLVGFRGIVPMEIMQACAGVRGTAQWRLWMSVQV